MRIFACDDEQLILNSLEKAVKEAAPSADLYLFSNPIDLLEQSSEIMPDVVFLDVKMPQMDGISLAKELQIINAKINIIFVTGYIEYMSDALDLFASGYIHKPIDSDKVKRQLVNLRHPIELETRFMAQTFGNFTLFLDGVPFAFPREKCKEIFAYLVDRNGAEVGRRELALYIFEDKSYSRETQRYMSNLLKFLMDALEKVNAKELINHTPRGYSINKKLLSSDLFSFLDGENINSYRGEYMEQYSWGENFKGKYCL